MESLPLKDLDYGLQKTTGPSSGVVASIFSIIIALSSVCFFVFFTQLTHLSDCIEDTLLRTTFLKIRIVV